MKNFKYTIALTCTLLFSVIAFAQPGFEDDVEDVAPIPGLVLAAVAGLAIGAKKIYSSKK